MPEIIVKNIMVSLGIKEHNNSQLYFIKCPSSKSIHPSRKLVSTELVNSLQITELYTSANLLFPTLGEPKLYIVTNMTPFL